MRAAVCQLSRVSWNAVVVTARDSALLLEERGRDATEPVKEIVETVAGPLVTSVRNSVASAQQGAESIQQQATKADEAYASLLSTLPESLRPKRERVQDAAPGLLVSPSISEAAEGAK